ncbi:MAG: DHA2 family efflux MFS transporter permease subunit [Burkholderiaceae bacterium]
MTAIQVDGGAAPQKAPAPSPAQAAGSYPPLTGAAKIIGTISLALATFMNVLDTSIANVSLSSIAGDLGVSSSQATWVITSFAVANAIALPLTGWLTQRFGAVKLFTVSVLLFVITSWMCGLATSLPMLILFRVMQGFVAGPMIPLSQALLLSSYPKAQAGMALAVWSVTTLVAPVMGPMLGGWITDNISWPWIFYINIPVGIAAAWVSWTIFKKRESPTRKLPIDGVGLGLLVLWVGSLQIMLDKGKELDWFHSGFIVTLAAVAVVAFACFLVWELVDNDHPVVDLRLFKLRNFWTGTLTLALGYGVFFGNVVLMPLWLQQYMGYTATDAGLLTAPVGLLAILLSPFVGKYIAKVDPRLFATAAFMIFGAALYWRTFYNTQANFGYLVRPIILQGAAMAFFFIPLVTLTLSGLPPDRIAAASGLSNFARITAGAFGTSIATTMWEDRATLHHAQLAESINHGSTSATQYIQQLQSSGLSPAQALAAINRTIDVQAYMLGANDIFYASAILFVLLVGVVWIARPAKGGGGGAEAAAGAH